MKRIRLLIGHAHPLLLAALEHLLSGEFHVVGAEQTTDGLISAALIRNPHVVIVHTSILPSIEIMRELKTSLPDIRVLLLTDGGVSFRKEDAIALGAGDCISLQDSPETLLLAIRSALDISKRTSPGQKSALARRSQVIKKLTPRQRQVLQLVTEGLTLREIATALNLSVKTVEFHKYRLMAQLGTRSTAELTRIAILYGLVRVA